MMHGQKNIQFIALSLLEDQPTESWSTLYFTDIFSVVNWKIIKHFSVSLKFYLKRFLIIIIYSI